MKPIKFKEANKVYAENQPEYLPLPAFVGDAINNPKGEVVFCMRMTFKERVVALFTGKIYCSLMMFRDPKTKRLNDLTPSFFSVYKSDFTLENRIKLGDME